MTYGTNLEGVHDQLGGGMHVPGYPLELEDCTCPHDPVQHGGRWLGNPGCQTKGCFCPGTWREVRA